MPSRPLNDRGGARSQYSGSMASSGGKRRRPHKKRKIGRKILALLVLGVLAWFSREEIKTTVRSWIQNVPENAAVKVIKASPSTETNSAGNEVVNDTMTNAQNVNVAADTVAEAGLMSRAGDWLEDRLSDVFQVKSIELEGQRSLQEAELREGLDSLQGSPLLEVDPRQIADSLRKHPRIKDVVIGRQFPSTVKVTVEERREVAVLISNGGVWGIDESRVVLPLPGRAWPLDLPVISGLKRDPGAGSTLNDAGVSAALNWVRAAKEQPRVQAWLSEIHVNDGQIIWIAGQDGRVVLPGEHPVIAQVATLDAFLASNAIEMDGRKIVDLTFPDYLILRDEMWTGNTATEG